MPHPQFRIIRSFNLCANPARRPRDRAVSAPSIATGFANCRRLRGWLAARCAPLT